MTVQIVLDVILPILNGMKQDLNHLTTNVSNLGDNVSNLEKKVSNLENTIEEHKTQTISELADLNTSIDNPPTDEISLEIILSLLHT